MKPYIRYGLMLAGVNAAINLIPFGLGIERDEIVQRISGYVSVALSAWVIYLAIKHRRNIENGGFLSIGQGLGTGFRMSMVAASINGVFMWIYFKIMNPDLTDFMLQAQEEKMLQRGMSQSEVDTAMAMASKFSGPLPYAIFAVFGTIMIAFIISLIVSAFMKRENPNGPL